MASITRFPNYTGEAAVIGLKRQIPYLEALEIVADRIRRKINAARGPVPLHLTRGRDAVTARIEEINNGTW